MLGARKALRRGATQQLARLGRTRFSTAVQHDPNEDLEAENARLRAELEELRGYRPRTTGKSLFVGAQTEFVSEPHFWYPHVDHMPPALPCFRLIDDLGRVVPGAEGYVPELSRELALAAMATMVRVSEFDKIFLDAQRQGRISFYMTSRGEEAASVGSAAAIHPTDWALPQYRELGLFFWRGFTFADVANQLCANEHDPAHGRQLPLHMGSRDKHILYVKSTLGTQCPHAAGASMAAKYSGNNQVAIAYFGEGCASEGDIPSALNIAAVHGCPTIFFCRNNGYAISTNTRDQCAPHSPCPTLATLPTRIAMLRPLACWNGAGGKLWECSPRAVQSSPRAHRPQTGTPRTASRRAGQLTGCLQSVSTVTTFSQ